MTFTGAVRPVRWSCVSVWLSRAAPRRCVSLAGLSVCHGRLRGAVSVWRGCLCVTDGSAALCQSGGTVCVSRTAPRRCVSLAGLSVCHGRLRGAVSVWWGCLCVTDGSAGLRWQTSPAALSREVSFSSPVVGCSRHGSGRVLRLNG